MTLKNKFILVGCIILLSMVGIFSIGHYTAKKIETFDNVRLHLSLVETGMLTLRRNEKDFLVRKDLIYIDTFNNNYDDLTARISHLHDSVTNANLDITLVNETEQTIRIYKEKLTQVFELQKEIGLHHEDGLYGALRESAHAAEDEILRLGDTNLRAHMLQLRRNEKDFMLRFDLTYQKQFIDNMAIFNRDLKSSKHGETAKDAMKNSMQEYQARFFNLVDDNVKIGLNSDSGLLGELRGSVHTAEDTLKHLRNLLSLGIKNEIGSVDQLLIIEDIVSAILGLIVTTMLFLLASSMLKPLQELSNIMVAVAQDNDLTMRVSNLKKDEIGETGKAFNDMLEKFQKILAQVNGVTGELSAATHKMIDISTNTNNGIQQQRIQTGELATSITEMEQKVSAISNCADEATAATKTASETSNKGQKVIDVSTQSIKELSKSIHNAEQAIKKVDEDSIKIGSVLEVIENIAEQTNLLALNAAIEAARAGEQGRGFAVVADEVRTLAGSTQSATQEIQKTIDSLQARSKATVELMTDSREQVENNVSQTAAAGEAFSSIVESVNVIGAINKNIYSVVVEQETVMKNINQNTQTIENITETSVKGSHETELASNNLSTLAQKLEESSSQFKS